MERDDGAVMALAALGTDKGLALQVDAGLVVSQHQQVGVYGVHRLRPGDALADPADDVIRLDALDADLGGAQGGEELLGPVEQLVALLDLDRAFFGVFLGLLALVVGEDAGAVVAAHVVGDDDLARAFSALQDLAQNPGQDAGRTHLPVRKVAVGLDTVNRFFVLRTVVGMLCNSPKVDDVVHGVTPRKRGRPGLGTGRVR
ncbi:hypothetical protein D3C85_996150 [compost metagenome]